MSHDASRLLAAIERREIRGIARAVSLIERGAVAADEIIDHLYPASGKAHVIGVTGPPGAGKSTLINQLIRWYRQQGARLAVIAIDPTSPLTGGAVLGDRFRLMDHASDPNVFVRSMASRDQTGGLAPRTASVVHVLDAVGFDPIIVETVGAGQREIDIINVAMTTVLLQVPNLGDDLQALKAGSLEVGDILAVSKSDLPGADTLVRQLTQMLSLVPHAVDESSTPTTNVWRVPVVTVSQEARETVTSLAEAVGDHRRFLESSGHWSIRLRQRAATEITMQIQQRLLAAVTLDQQPNDVHSIVSSVAERHLSPRMAVQNIMHSR